MGWLWVWSSFWGVNVTIGLKVSYPESLLTSRYCVSGNAGYGFCQPRHCCLCYTDETLRCLHSSHRFISWVPTSLWTGGLTFPLQSSSVTSLLWFSTTVHFHLTKSFKYSLGTCYIGGSQDLFRSDFVIYLIGCSSLFMSLGLWSITKVIDQKCDLEGGGDTKDKRKILGVPFPSYPLSGR